MKNFIFLCATFITSFSAFCQSQVNTPKRLYLDRYNVELTADSLWTVNRVSISKYELLYDCTGKVHCANIQLNADTDSSATSRGIFDYVIKGFKASYQEVIHNESASTGIGLQFALLDLRLKSGKHYTGQTLAMARLGGRWLTMVFTALPEPLENWARNYVTQRARFINLLKTVLVSPMPKACSLHACKDSVQWLVSPQDNMKYAVRLQRKATERVGEHSVRFDGTDLLSAFLHFKKSFELDIQLTTSEDSIKVLHSYADLYTSMIKVSMNPELSGKKIINYLETWTLSIPFLGNALIWRIVDRRNGEMIEHRLGRRVFATVIEGDFFYTVDIVHRGDQTLSKIRGLLSDMIRSLRIQQDTQSIAEVCN